MYLFTWERVRCDRHTPDKEVARMADGTRISFCLLCNFICFWR